MIKKFFLIFVSMFSLFIFANGLAATPGLPSRGEEALTAEMDNNMRMMVNTYEHVLGRDLQLRATDLFMMGQALLNHKGHKQCQIDGTKAVKLATQIYAVGLKLSGGKEINPKQAKKFVKDWTLK